MPAILKVTLGSVVYLVLTGFLAALIAFPVFLLEGTGDVSFLRSLVSRIGQGVLLIGFYPLALGLSLKPRDLGLSWPPLNAIPKGFLIGVALLGGHAVFLALTQIRIFVPPSVAHGLPLVSLLIKSLGIGLGVALLEEITFRGAMLGVFLKTLTRPQALAISAFFFAALHFIGSQWSAPAANLGFDAPFRIAMDGFANLVHAPKDAFLALFVAGLFLGLVRLHFRGGLGLCIGIHAGWVFVIRLTKTWTYPNPKSEAAAWISTYDHVIGYFSALWLGLGVMALIYFFHTAKGPTGMSAGSGDNP